MKKNKSLLTEQFITEWLTPDVGFVFRSGEVLDDFSSPYQHIEVMETAAFGRVFRLDGYLMTSEADEWFYHENLNHIPAITHPDPRSALIIGGGDGGSARQLLKYPSIEQVVVCELDAGVVAIADEYFAKVHQGAFHDPRLQLVIGDGLKYVAESQQQFDLIVLDLTDPQGYAEPLYTRAFFADCARLLDKESQVAAIGVNCTAPQYVADLIRNIRAHTAKPVVVYPNTGETYDAVTKTWHGSPTPYHDFVRQWYEAGARLIGGCCRTTPDDIRGIAAFRANLQHG